MLGAEMAKAFKLMPANNKARQLRRRNSKGWYDVLTGEITGINNYSTRVTSNTPRSRLMCVEYLRPH